MYWDKIDFPESRVAQNYNAPTILVIKKLHSPEQILSLANVLLYSPAVTLVFLS